MFQVKICSQQLEICVHVCRPRHCCGDWLTFDCFVPMIADRDEKINNHGCWGKHAHIPDNDYSGICLFHVVWTNFFLQLLLCGTHGIYIYFFFSSTELVWRVIPLEMHFFVDSLLLVTQIIKGKQLYYKMWSSKS